ncbi:uncharacterized protein LOC127014673 isoform X2 [Gymnogyps californianus]|uniref:uncharacterized protein LOC127014673 isoform X2 n=1 Tax=Gymnogyps californianus TaxID=33616 RepID=UPI0021C80EE1|nr:uncharacterized protein LOC127014673 isoform X2 [Gymnogyps californianus]
MEALRAAGRAVLRSPRLARHGLGLRRRRKLPESWADMQEPLLEGMCFTLKYLGMTLVEKPKGEDMAAAAIRRIVATARVGARKSQKVILTVSPRGISLQDADTKEMVENISIYRISYCTTDKLQNKVFAYVAQSQESGALECHAFLSPKKKIAQAVTLTVAQAFQMALDLWEAAHAGSRQEQALHPSCVLESSEPGRPSEPAPRGALPSDTSLGRRKRRRKMITSVKPYLGLAWGMMGALFFSKAAWRSWGGEPTAQQSQHFLCPERALLLHSYCATAWGNPQTAGRGWEGLEASPQLAPGLLAPRLPWAKPNLCNNGPATQDSPCACTRARQCLSLPPALPTRHGVCWHHCHAVHRLRHPLLVLLSACMNRLKLQLLPAPSSGWWTGAARSAHSQCMQSHPKCSEPAGCSQCTLHCTVSHPPCLFLPPCSSWWHLGTS